MVYEFREGRVVGAQAHFLFGFLFHISFFFPYLGKQVNSYRGKICLKCFSSISLFCSLCYLLSLHSLRGNSYPPTMYKQMLGSGNALCYKIRFPGQSQAYVCLRLLTLAFHGATEKHVIFLIHSRSSVPRRLSGSQAILICFPETPHSPPQPLSNAAFYLLVFICHHLNFVLFQGED